MADTKISVGNATITGTKAVFPLTRVGDLSQESAVRFQTKDGSAVGQGDYDVEGANFRRVTGTRVFEAGAKEKTVEVDILDRAAGDVDFALELVDTTFGTIAVRTGKATIPGSGAAAPTVDQEGGGPTAVPSIDGVEVNYLAETKWTGDDSAFVKDLNKLLVKYGKKSSSKDALIPASDLLALSAHVVGRVLALQDLALMTIYRANAIFTANKNAGFLAARAEQQNALRDAVAAKAGSVLVPPPGPVLAKIVSGGGGAAPAN